MNKKGYVYILSNESMPGIIKIGHSMRSGKQRAIELYKTGVPTQFLCEFEILCDNPLEIEMLTHERLNKHRVNNSREFFRISIDEAIIEITNVFVSQYDSCVTYIEERVDIADILLMGDKLETQGIRVYFPAIVEALSRVHIDSLTDPLIEIYSRYQKGLGNGKN